MVFILLLLFYGVRFYYQNKDFSKKLFERNSQRHSGRQNQKLWPRKNKGERVRYIEREVGGKKENELGREREYERERERESLCVRLHFHVS